MPAYKEPTVEEQALVVVVFDRSTGKYCVNGGPWLEHGYVEPKEDDRHAILHGAPPSQSPSSPQRPSSPPSSSSQSSSSSQRPSSPPSSSSQSSSSSTPPSGSDEDLTRCLRSTMVGHVGHCHTKVWDGAQWVDTGRHCTGCV